MTWRKRTIMEMAREAGAIPIHKDYKQNALVGNENIEAFEKLVREDEAEKYKWDIHSCGPTCERYACVAMREAVLAEREACAKVCETSVWSRDVRWWQSATKSDVSVEAALQCAEAILARGEQA